MDSIYTQNDASNDRSLNRSYLPSSIKGNAVSPVQASVTTLSSSVSLVNNGTATFSVLIQTKNKNWLFTELDTAVFVDNNSDPAANLLPGGSAINHGNWVLYGPVSTPYDLTGVHGANYQHLARVGVTNLSGSTHTILVDSTCRYIANAGDTITT